MARGVISVGKTQQEAEQGVLADGKDAMLRVVRSRRMDLTDLGPTWANANFWIVVVEWIDPTRPDPLPNWPDPEGQAEATFRTDHARDFGAHSNN